MRVRVLLSIVNHTQANAAEHKSPAGTDHGCLSVTSDDICCCPWLQRMQLVNCGHWPASVGGLVH